MHELKKNYNNSDYFSAQAFIKARAKFRAAAVNTVINIVQVSMGLAATVASAPTGLGAAMAGLATAIALRKVAFNSRDTAHLYCTMNAEWQVYCTVPRACDDFGYL